MKKNISRANLAFQSRTHRLVLIDGNAILHRAYHALPPLTTPDGTIVNAVYGFVSILIKLFQDLKPTYMAVAFDRAAPTFRKKLYKDYQASRPKMEDALVGQISIVHDVVAAFGIPNFELDGYEADDIIGTLCRLVTSDKRQETSKKKIHMNVILNGSHVSGLMSPDHKIQEMIIVTGDKDILQLVDDAKRVKVFMPTKGLSEGKIYGEAEVVERLGVTPKQIPELKALMGDNSDNYPGVAGIGPKTAVDLITRYGSIEKVYQTLKKSNQELRIMNQEKNLSAGVIEKLRNGEEMARMSKDLATIRTDVPVEIKTLQTIETLDTLKVREKLSELHFSSLLKRITGGKEEKEKREEGEEKMEKKSGEQQELF